MTDEEYWEQRRREEGFFGFKGLIKDCDFAHCDWRDWLVFIATVLVGSAFMWLCMFACGL